MHVVRARNVRGALVSGMRYLLQHGETEKSRNGDVIVAPGPVTTVYECPTERVLLSPVRDANPFFHLAEALWMLAGRDDAAFLNLFVKDFGARFADGETVHGAYGHRWRRALGFDQLDYIVEKLRRDPSSRQCVIQMWDATPAHWVSTGPGPLAGHSIGSEDLCGDWKDRPCNTHVYLRVREEHGVTVRPVTEADRAVRRSPAVELNSHAMDMTVCCRSNDIVWGAYGANAVHFSVLQEYLAARIGVGVGRMYQVSSNFHAYVSELSKLRTRVGAECAGLALPVALSSGHEYPTSRKLVTSPDTFDAECARLLVLHEALDWSADSRAWPSHREVGEMRNSFLTNVAWPMLTAHGCHRRGEQKRALSWVSMTLAADWCEAGMQWLERRYAS